MFENWSRISTRRRDPSGRVEGVQGIWPLPPEEDKGLVQAEKLAYFISNEIGILFIMNEDKTFEIGSRMFAGIGSIEIQVKGQLRRRYDLAETFGQLPLLPMTMSPLQPRFDEWKERAKERRRRYGLGLGEETA
jgi:hypothetical protein